MSEATRHEHQLSRNELYDLARSEPITTVVTRSAYRMSLFAKACLHYDSRAGNNKPDRAKELESRPPATPKLAT
jgi:hypothetical protein